MPWLNVHIALPLAIIAGTFVGEMPADAATSAPTCRSSSAWRRTCTPSIAAALSVLVFVIVGPFSLASAGAWILAAVAAVAFVWAFTSYSRRTALQVAIVGLIAALMIFTLRAGVLSSLDQADVNAAEASYSPGLSQDDHGALPVELLVYTQTSGDIPILVNKLEQYGSQTGQGRQPAGRRRLRRWLHVAVGVVPAQLQRRRSTRRSRRATSRRAGSVLFIASQDAPNLNLGDGYSDGVPYHHRRWFPEDYRGTDGVYSTHDFFGDLFSKTGWSHMARLLDPPDAAR